VLRPLEQPREGLQFGLQQQPGGSRQQVGDALGGGVRAMSGTKGVVDVEVCLGGQLGGQRGIVPLLAGVEAEVLEHPQVARLLAEGDVAVEQLCDPVGDRAQRQLRLSLAPRATQMRAQHHPRAALQQQLDGRHRGLNAGVVGDPPAVQRHVQVGPHQHPLAGHVQIANAAHGRATRSC
jgi:hypothetical protein